MTLLEAIDAGPKTLKEYRAAPYRGRSRSEMRHDLQKLQKAGVIYWVPASSGRGSTAYTVHGHWARCLARAPKT